MIAEFLLRVFDLTLSLPSLGNDQDAKLSASFKRKNVKMKKNKTWMPISDQPLPNQP